MRNKKEEEVDILRLIWLSSLTWKKLDTLTGWWDLSRTRNRFSPRREAIVGYPVINQRCKRSSDRREINAGGGGSIFLFLHTSFLRLANVEILCRRRHGPGIRVGGRRAARSL